MNYQGDYFILQEDEEVFRLEEDVFMGGHLITKGTPFSIELISEDED